MMFAAFPKIILKIMRKAFLLITIILFIAECNSQGWVQVFYGPDLPYNSVFFINENTGWICAGKSEGQGYTGKIMKSFNSGLNWFNLYNDSVKFTSVYFSDINTGYTTGQKRVNSIYSVEVLKSTDGGFSFFTVFSYPSSSTPLKIQFKGFNGYVFLDNNILLRTTNSGINWQAVTTGANSIADGYFTASDTGFIANSFNSVLKTNNAGLNWYQVLGAGKIFWKSISFVNNMTGWVTDGSSLRQTTNGGQSWNFLNGGSNRFINFVNPSTGWSSGIIQSAYISRTIDGGSSWQQQTVLFNNMYFTKLHFINQSTGWAVGYSYVNPVYSSIILRTTNGGFTAVEQISSNIPQAFTLSQNYPNPFNPSTNFQFSIPKPGLVNITIYDALGRKVETLVNQELKPGTYKVDWSASAYPSGVYFYRLSAGDYTETKKMVLIK
jgi:photosystem II stability/assembly factor-like uncharacterized protein